MQTLEYRFEDKSDWGAGPWQDEPDKRQWRDAETGLPCLIVRNMFGALCGYVGISKGHPAYEAEYDDVDVDVHGGLTFAGKCCEGSEHGICHKVDPGEDDDVWWLGFDAGHFRDLSPASEARDRARGFGPIGNPIYRDISYVESECASLAKQLAAMVETVA
jgi:hypothetical protein